jgi:Flp pilus assembly protein TadG
MIPRPIRSLRSNESGAVASLYAIAILTLVAMAGIGFDYGRMVALDTELQNAADQAALAAATQLDGRDGAIDRARNAATDTFATATSEFVNETRFANDDGGRAIVDLGFVFYDGYVDDAPGAVAADDADAKVVEVTVNPREVHYALTPLVGAVYDRAMGRAMATIEDSTCNVPPLMFCSPSRSFPGPGDVGKGVPLHMKKNQANTNPDDPLAENPAWAPGNFGFLDIDYDRKGKKNVTLGYNSTTAGCFNDEIQSRTGFRTPEARALNTRFDIYENSAPSCDNDNGDFCPAANVRKNWVKVESYNVKPGDIRGLSCGGAGNGNGNGNNNSWKPLSEITANPPANPGFPCDTAGCTAFGSGDWGAGSWLPIQHPGHTLAEVPDLDGNGSISRYEVYVWELAGPNLLDAQKLGYSLTDAQIDALVASQPNKKVDVDLYCSYPTPQEDPFTSSAPQKDRRLLTVAAVDCTGLNGHAAVDILGWVDMFLVTPADQTTGSDDAEAGRSFYAEVVSPAKQANGDSGFQYYSRKKAVLIR